MKWRRGNTAKNRGESVKSFHIAILAISVISISVYPASGKERQSEYHSAWELAITKASTATEPKMIWQSRTEQREVEIGLNSQQALEILKQIPVKGRAPKTGYSRSAFGPQWSDVDRNGCDTRNDILTRDLKSVTISLAPVIA